MKSKLSLVLGVVKDAMAPMQGLTLKVQSPGKVDCCQALSDSKYQLFFSGPFVQSS